ncbi:MAG: carbohydrate kinase family protein [Woeseia sp.]
MPDNLEPRTVCCIGGMTLDSTLKLQEPGITGTSNPVRSRRTRGGVARNVAENLARLSVSCKLISIVGNDEAGRTVLQDTARQDVDTGLVQKSLREATGTCSRAMQPDGELFVGFADMGICDLMGRNFIQSRWLQIASAALVFADTNLPAESLSYLITGCREHGLTLVLDAVSASKARKLPLNLHGVDMLFCNTGEARAMLGDDIAKDVEGMARALCRRGAASTIVTAGADGIAFANEGRCIALPASTTQVVDVSGAGDALVAGTLYGRLMDYNPVTSLQIGLNAAGMTIACEDCNCPDLSVEAVTAGLNL